MTALVARADEPEILAARADGRAMSESAATTYALATVVKPTPA
jgi:hypothetical protein